MGQPPVRRLPAGNRAKPGVSPYSLKLVPAHLTDQSDRALTAIVEVAFAEADLRSAAPFHPAPFRTPKLVPRRFGRLHDASRISSTFSAIASCSQFGIFNPSGNHFRLLWHLRCLHSLFVTKVTHALSGSISESQRLHLTGRLTLTRYSRRATDQAACAPAHAMRRLTISCPAAIRPRPKP